MMNCDDLKNCVEGLFVLKSASELPAAQQAHLERCTRCSQFVEERIALDALLDRVGDIEPQPGLVRDVLARIEEPVVLPRDARPRVSMSLRRVAALLIAAAAIVVGVRFYCGDRPGTNGRTSETGAEEPPDAAMLANLDLLLNWDVLDEHAEDLDLITAEDLASAASDPQEG